MNILPKSVERIRYGSIHPYSNAECPLCNKKFIKDELIATCCTIEGFIVICHKDCEDTLGKKPD